MQPNPNLIIIDYIIKWYRIQIIRHVQYFLHTKNKIHQINNKSAMHKKFKFMVWNSSEHDGRVLDTLFQFEVLPNSRRLFDVFCMNSRTRCRSGKHGSRYKLFWNPCSVFRTGRMRCWYWRPSSFFDLIYMASPDLLLENTESPTANSLFRACRSWLYFCWDCLALTWAAVSGRGRSNRVRSSRWRNNVLGVTPVVQWGVLR